MRNGPLLPYFLIISAGVMWGGTFSLALIATADSTHPVMLASWQVVISAIFFIGICRFSRVPVFKLQRLPIYTLLALLGIILPDLLYYYAAPHLNAGILWGIVIFAEVHTLWVWLSVVVMMAGLALVTPAASVVPKLGEQTI